MALSEPLAPCKMCQASGPALLPVRYAVVPATIKQRLPDWAAATFPSSDEYHYALRVLRQGFFYVFYSQSGELEDSWEAWSVTEDGELWKQYNIFGLQPQKSSNCTNPAHSITNTEFIVLRDSALRNDVSVAFSPSPWSRDTLIKYHNSETARNKRMQSISYQRWASATNQQQGNHQATCLVSNDALNAVLDYQLPQSFSFSSLKTFFKTELPFNPTLARISQTHANAPYYSFDEQQIGPKGTLYPWSIGRANRIDTTIEMMKKRGMSADGKPVAPLMIAVHDPIGIAHELAGWTDDITALHSQWLDDLSIEFMTDESLRAVKEQIENRAAKEQEKMEQQAPYYGAMIYSYTAPYTHQSVEEFDEQFKKTSQQSAREHGQRIAADWNRYDQKLNHAKRQAFSDCYDKFCQVIADKQERLAQLRVQWLTQPIFIACCQDFESAKIADNLCYREAVDYGFASLNLTQSGTKYLDSQIDQYSTQDPANIVWRSLLLNNPQIMEELQQLLSKMAEMKGKVLLPEDKSKLSDLLAPLSGRFVYYYDKANEIMEKPPVANSSFARTILHYDRRLTTLGDRFFNFTRLEKVLNSGTELISKTLFQISSGVAFDKAAELSLSQLADGDNLRKYVLERLKTENKENRVKLNNQYKENFDQFVASEKGQPELKKMRIKLLVLFFNGLELANLYNQSKGGVKERTQITAAALVLFSTTMDIITPVVERGFQHLGATNHIKLLGNGAAMIASVLTLSIDGTALGNELLSNQRRWQLIGLNLAKVANDVGILAKSLMGVLDVLASKGILNKVLVERWAASALMRYLGWFASWEVMLAIFFIEAVFMDNSLQKWCEAGVFGNQPDDQLKRTELLALTQRNTIYKEQLAALESAIGNVL